MTERMPHISSVWAYLAIDEDGDESVLGAQIGPNNSWMALVAADEKRMLSLRPLVEQIAIDLGIAVRLVQFTTRVDFAVISGASVARQPAESMSEQASEPQPLNRDAVEALAKNFLAAIRKHYLSRPTVRTTAQEVLNALGSVAGVIIGGAAANGPQQLDEAREFFMRSMDEQIVQIGKDAGEQTETDDDGLPYRH